jgi:GntR family transcriptional regulator, transcriptional repressor for pyruvate dehydrogenase complex
MPNSERVLDVLDELQYQITSGRYAPGDRLPPERVLSASLDVSRGVVREALGMLAGMGLVKSRQGSGSYVEPPSGGQITAGYRRLLSDVNYPQHLCAVRLSLETSIAGLAAVHRTEADLEALERTQEVLANPRRSLDALSTAAIDFHSQLCKASANPIFEIVLAPIHGLLLEYSHRAIPRHGSFTIFEQHGRILEAVRAGDADAASRLMIEHVEFVSKHIIEELDENGFHQRPRARDHAVRRR